MEMQIEENLSYNSEDPQLYEDINTENVALQEENEKMLSYSQTAQEPQLTPQENVTEQIKNQEQPLYVLNNIDTEASIKTEIKELIVARVSEEINTVILQHMNDEMEQQTTSLRTLISNQQDKNGQLKKELESDEKRLAQSEQVLLRANEIIELLKGSVEKIMIRQVQSGISKVLERSEQQRKTWETLKNSYLTKLKTAKEYLADEENKRLVELTVLKRELAEKKEMLEQTKIRVDELKKNTAVHEDDIEKYLTKKNILENKLIAASKKRTAIEEGQAEQKSLFEKLCKIEDEQNIKLSKVDAQKIQIEQDIEKVSKEMENAKLSLLITQEQISEKQETLDKLKATLENAKEKSEESLKELQGKFDDMTAQLNESEQQNVSSGFNLDQLLMELDSLKTEYVKKCATESELINRNLEQKNKIHDFNLTLYKKQTANEIEKGKLEGLQKIFETTTKTLNSLNVEVPKERDQVSKELMQIRLKFNVTQADYVKYSSEIAKKKDYLIENSKFLEQKCENMLREVGEFEQKIEKRREENSTMDGLINEKLKQFEEYKNKVETLKTGTKVPLKSGFKSPKKDNLAKKVKFNDVLSFKSPSSSDISNLPGENSSQLETSFHAWLTSASNSAEKIEAEF